MSRGPYVVMKLNAATAQAIRRALIYVLADDRLCNAAFGRKTRDHEIARGALRRLTDEFGHAAIARGGEVDLRADVVASP